MDDVFEELTAQSRPPHAEMILNFIASAYIGVIFWWVEQDCPGSPAEVAAHLLTLTIQGPYRAFGLTAPGRVAQPRYAFRTSDVNTQIDTVHE